MAAAEANGRAYVYTAGGHRFDAVGREFRTNDNTPDPGREGSRAVSIEAKHLGRKFLVKGGLVNDRKERNNKSNST